MQNVKSYWLVLSGMVITSLLYWPGSSGIFLLDDLPNLSPLQTFQSSATFEQYMLYFGTVVSQGSTRVVSLLSFIAQAESWPMQPEAFKQVNIVLHLFNGLLIYVLLLQALQLSKLKLSVSPHWLAAIVASIWLIHPLHMSTVLYVIQRMTELMTLFTLLGLVFYLHGRSQLISGVTTRALLNMTLGVGLFGGLAVLCKENGVLILLYILILELTLFAKQSRPAIWWRWSTVCLFAPLLILMGYFIWNADSYFINGYVQRDFTLVERVLTQTRVLFEYVWMILWPTADSMRFFYDDYALSTSMLSPWTTLLALAGLLLALTFAVMWRRRYPLISLGVLWYLAGHILESSIFPLEIMFEHRNYLPSVGIILLLVMLGTMVFQRCHSDSQQRIAYLLTAAVFVLLAANTFQHASIWGKPLVQSARWAQQSPHSIRAQDHHATLSIIAGDTQSALEIYSRQKQQNPQDLFLLTKYLSLDCHGVQLAIPDIGTVAPELLTGQLNKSVLNTIKSMLFLYKEDRCRQINSEYLHSLMNALIVNPAYSRQQRGLYMLKAELSFIDGDIEAMSSHIDSAMQGSKKPSTGLVAAERLAQAGRYERAVYYLDRVEEQASGTLAAWFYQFSVPVWRQRLLAAQSQNQ